MSGFMLVSTQDLDVHLARWRIFDCRHDLAAPQLGERQYADGHIPGAAFAHLDRDLSGARSGTNGRHPLPDRGAFVAWLGQHGLHPADTVVCYDAGNGVMAARLWWMLRWVGHVRVAVLDGGFAKWVAEKRLVTTDVPRHPHSSYPILPSAERVLGASEVEGALDRLLLLDARAPARYRGEHEPIDPVAGHIPGAQNRPSAENVRPDGTFKDPHTLREEFARVLGGRDPSEVVHYCGSGVSACHNLLAMEIAGLRGGKLYAGSWSEWSADPKRPIAR